MIHIGLCALKVLASKCIEHNKSRTCLENLLQQNWRFQKQQTAFGYGEAYQTGENKSPRRWRTEKGNRKMASQPMGRISEVVNLQGGKKSDSPGVNKAYGGLLREEDAMLGYKAS